MNEVLPCLHSSSFPVINPVSTVATAVSKDRNTQFTMYKRKVPSVAVVSSEEMRVNSEHAEPDSIFPSVSAVGGDEMLYNSKDTKHGSLVPSVPQPHSCCPGAA